MITGVVTAQREAVVRLTVHDDGGGRHEINAVIDTGFDGYLTLPESLVALLGLTWQSRGRVLLADGSENVCDVFDGTITWDGTHRRISIDAAETEPLIGMALLAGHELVMHVIEGGQVRITRLQ
jgi:clan AA aspartic protease